MAGQWKKIISGTLLITGTTVGAGMLGIPLLTAKAGFFPAAMITTFAWLLMLLTGLLYLEATLWMPIGSNLISISARFLGKRGRFFSALMFLFLYYCLLVAYFAAGSPLLAQGIERLFPISLSGVYGYTFFGALFVFLTAMGAKWIDRSNFLLAIGLFLSYFCLIGVGSPAIQTDRLVFFEWSVAPLAMPVLFSAFGYHNVIPSLVNYFKKDVRSLRLSVILGSAIPLIIYLIWQWLVIGIIPQENIALALEEGQPVTAALHGETGDLWIFRFGQTFAFFAIVTSLLGVSFSMIDFLADGMRVKRTGLPRLGLALLTFFPPFICVSLYPKIFDVALGIAGGIGEAILNGVIPILLVWVGRYRKKLDPIQTGIESSRTLMTAALIVILIVMGIEIYELLVGA